MAGVEVEYKSPWALDWKFANNVEGGTLSGSEDRIVDAIVIGTESDRNLLLKDVVASYGYPEYVKPFDCREGTCTPLLVYPDLGIFLRVFLENTGSVDRPQFEVLADTVIHRICFMEKGIEAFRKVADLQEYALLWEWKGYGEYP